MSIELNKNMAIKFALEKQMLIDNNFSYSSKREELKTIIERLSYVQIDTISVIERAHHHTLWTRMPSYKKELLNELQINNREIFEYWSHAAAYLPIRDYKYSLIRKKEYRNSKNTWFKRDAKVRAYVKDRISAEGELMAKDFKTEKPRNSKGWWDWKPAKIALDQLYLEGYLEVVCRRGFQKVYDLPERVISNYSEYKCPTDDEYVDYLIQRCLEAHGFASLNTICHLKRGIKPKVKLQLNKMIEAGTISELSFDTADNKSKYYCFKRDLELMDKEKRLETVVHFLCPFDNALIYRDRFKNLFDFEYKLECYVPSAKRIYGYYSLVVIWCGLPVGLIEFKAHRKKACLEVISFHQFSKIKSKTRFKKAVASKIEDLQKFTACELELKNTVLI